MSNTTLSLRRKIIGAEDIRSVVRTMKAVAASSIGQYEKSVLALAAYYRSLELGLSACLQNSAQTIPFEAKKLAAASIQVVVFGSDQGLVGRFNDIVSDFTVKTLSTLPGKARVWAVGERVHARLVDAGLLVLDLFKLPSSIRGITPLVGQLLLEHEKLSDRDENSPLYLFYNRPGSTGAYAPVAQRLLPLDHEWLLKLTQNPWPDGRYAQVIGDRTTTLRALINEYLFLSLFRACAESLASENASRLAAMQRADQNIDELLSSLRGNFHKLRKRSIDEELFDVIAAFDSLNHDSRAVR